MKEIILTQGLVTLIDDEDFELIYQYKWHTYKDHGYNRYYACSKIGTKYTYMHRFIMGAEKGQFVDHKDGNGLNNQKENLRICTGAQNMANRQLYKGYKGVYWEPRRNKWRAAIGYEGRLLHIGYYLDEEEAAKAYDKKASFLYGSFAYLNFGGNK